MKSWKRATAFTTALVLMMMLLFPAVISYGQTLSKQPLDVSITADMPSYGATDFAKITITVSNNGTAGVENVTINHFVPEGLKAFSKAPMRFFAGDIAPGAQKRTEYQVCLNPDRGDVNASQRFAIKFKSFFKRWSLPYADFSGPAGGQYSMNFSTSAGVSFGGRAETLTTTVYYGEAGRLNGAVINCLSGAPVAGAAVTAYQTAAPGGSTGLKVFSSTGPDGMYSLVLPAGTYNVTFSAPGFVAAIHYALTVTAGQTKSVQSINTVPGTASTPGQAGGKITNSSAGTAIAGATVRFRYGINRTGGDYYRDGGGNVMQKTTDASGVFSTALPCGNYTAEVVKSGFATLYYTVYSAAEGTGRLSQKAVMTSS